MATRFRWIPIVMTMALAGAGCAQQADPPSAEAMTASSTSQSDVERGEYLVTVGGCDDCHSPKVMGPMGPEPDMSRRLSGQPAGEPLPPVPVDLITPDKWGALTNNHFTEWAGAWGISYTRNLTPDVETGLGSWTEEMFINTIRNGKHQGEGRDLLPPMPWQNLAKMTDEDLKATWAFLRSLPPMRNAVPDPVAPETMHP